MSTPKKKNKNHLERDGPSGSGSRVVPGLMPFKANATANQFSASTRAELLGVKDVKDPFSAASDNAVKEFRDYIVNAAPDEINLEECSLLLHATAKLLSLQMKLQTDRMTELAAFVTNTAKEPSEHNDEEPQDGVGKKKRGRKKNEEKNSADSNESQEGNTNQGDSVIAEGSASQGESINGERSLNVGACSRQDAMDGGEHSSLPNPESTGSIINNSESSQAQTFTDESAEGPEVTKDQEMMDVDGSVNNLNESLLGSSVEPSTATGDNIETTCTDSGTCLVSSCDNNESSNLSNVSQSTTIVDKPENSSETPTVQNQDKAENPNDEPRPVNTASIIIPSTRTALKRQAKERPEGSPAKKRLLNRLSLPPHLSPNEYLNYDTVSEDESDGEYDAPLLYPEVDLWNGQFDPSADPDAPVVNELESDLLSEGIETLKINPQTIENSVDSNRADDDSMKTSSANVETAAVTNDSRSADCANTAVIVGSQSAIETSADDVNKSTPPATEGSGAVTDSSSSVANAKTGLGNVELKSLTTEDQQEIQDYINHLHYLPFTCELTKAELERTFDNTVGQLGEIFKKYNMVFNRQLLNAATVVCANMVSSLSNRPASGDQNSYKPAEESNNCREIFSQGSSGMQSGTMTSLINSEKTILERTKEKSFAESQATIQKRLEEMQRLIVPKYIQWPLIAENTPEFFHRVKQFEQKMKKVLADEEKKESFDVSKYEIEVLKATESNEEEVMELDESDDTNASCSTLPSLEDPSPNGVRRQSMMSPVFNGQSPNENGRKWVPLSSVFNHMKKVDRNECARHFYAVLALLSSQNLDMNYDRHFSQESAALVTKKLDHTQDGKYPRGFKIMTSRCPDADKEEIYVTALASKSCNETFRDLISNEMHRQELPDSNDLDCVGRRNDRTVSSVSSISNGEIHTDSDEEFVPVSYTTNFSTNLFGGRKKRKN